MEYCDEGTLEEVSRLGLQEHVIRLYSKQITTAINVLHEHGIVHRDIKGQCFVDITPPGLRKRSRIIVQNQQSIFGLSVTGANIFLTSSGLIKLGDFGCSVKLRNNTHTMPGEVNSTLGTAGEKRRCVRFELRDDVLCSRVVVLMNDNAGEYMQLMYQIFSLAHNFIPVSVCPAIIQKHFLTKFIKLCTLNYNTNAAPRNVFRKSVQ